MDNTKKIRALKDTRTLLQNQEYDYRWTSECKCNVGSLFYAVTGRHFISSEREYINYPLWIYACISSYRMCELEAIGFSSQDINHFENLTDVGILNSMNIPYTLTKGVWITNPNRSNRGYVIAYICAWITLLEAQQPEIKPEPIIKYIVRRESVKVDSKVSELVEQVVNN